MMCFVYLIGFCKMRNVVILENIRSAYNCGNIIRTADALWWDVWIVGYTPHPDEQQKVRKTSLGAEEYIGLKRFYYSKDAINFAKIQGFTVLAGEVTDNAIAIDEYASYSALEGKASPQNIALILWNEVDGVMDLTLKLVDDVVYIPMQGIKESLNVGQSSAIFMWALQ